MRASSRVLHAWVLLGLALGLLAFDFPAAAEETPRIFERYKQRLVEIRVLESSSGARAVTGSGFLVSAAGHVVTNYHVVSDLVHRPVQYRAEIVHHDGTVATATLLAFDLAHDLALVRTGVPSRSFFDFHADPIPKGTRVFSLGTPLDLGFTIVEGTYSGLIEDSLYEHMHFTGSINAGMSGGPAILPDGRVVGVNVATLGNQVSFLVPARFARALLEEATRPGAKATAPTLEQLRQQMLAHQDRVLSRLLSTPLPTTVLSPYRLPGRIAPYLRCWGDSMRKQENLYETVSWECSEQNEVHLSRSHTTGTLRFRHELITSDKLNRFRFYGLYKQFFENEPHGMRGSKEDVGRFTCTTTFVAPETLTLKVVVCLRAYKKLPGLYDAVLKAATLDGDTRGAQTTLTLGGVSAENAGKFVRRYLESVSWAR